VDLDIRDRAGDGVGHAADVAGLARVSGLRHFLLHLPEFLDAHLRHRLVGHQHQLAATQRRSGTSREQGQDGETQQRTTHGATP
jgi:hypothetical protein